MYGTVKRLSVEEMLVAKGPIFVGVHGTRCSIDQCCHSHEGTREAHISEYTHVLTASRSFSLLQVSGYVT